MVLTGITPVINYILSYHVTIMATPTASSGYGPSSASRISIFAGDVSSFPTFKLRFHVLMRTKGYWDVLDMGIEKYRAKVLDARSRAQTDELQKLQTIGGVIANDLLERISQSVIHDMSKVLAADKMSDGLELWHCLCTKYSPSADKVLEEGLFENTALKIINAARWNPSRGSLSSFVQGLCHQLDKLKLAKKYTQASFDVIQSVVLRAVLESVNGVVQYQQVHSSFYSQQVKADDFDVTHTHSRAGG